MNFNTQWIVKFVRFFVLVLSFGLCAFMVLAYTIQPDMLAAFTIWPSWVWVAVGLAMALAGMSRALWKPFALAMALWLVVAACFVEDLRAVCRFRSWPVTGWEQMRQNGRGVRIVSLNCNGGDLGAVKEVAAYEPDIVLLQESPPRSGLEPLAAGLTKGVGNGVLGLDTSLIVAGKGTEIPTGTPMLRLAWVELRGGRKIVVGSVRLAPAALREDLWSPDCWRIHAADRRRRREDVKRIVATLSAIAQDTPLILGGDFNIPARDASLRELRPRLQEAYGIAGKGWGATLLNDLPFLRIDQVWLSNHFRPLAVVAHQTQHSDHRLVVCDAMFVDPEKGH